MSDIYATSPLQGYQTSANLNSYGGGRTAPSQYQARYSKFPQATRYCSLTSENKDPGRISSTNKHAQQHDYNYQFDNPDGSTVYRGGYAYAGQPGSQSYHLNQGGHSWLESTKTPGTNGCGPYDGPSVYQNGFSYNTSSGLPTQRPLHPSRVSRGDINQSARFGAEATSDGNCGFHNNLGRRRLNHEGMQLHPQHNQYASKCPDEYGSKSVSNIPHDPPSQGREKTRDHYGVPGSSSGNCDAPYQRGIDDNNSHTTSRRQFTEVPGSRMAHNVSNSEGGYNEQYAGTYYAHGAKSHDEQDQSTAFAYMTHVYEAQEAGREADRTQKEAEKHKRNRDNKESRAREQFFVHAKTGKLLHRLHEGEQWMPAIFHSEIRKRALIEAESKGSYCHINYAGVDEHDDTSFVEAHQNWGPNWNDRPGVLFEFFKPENHLGVCGPEPWEWDGKRVLDHDGKWMWWYEDVPDTMSSTIEGWHLEALIRRNPTLRYGDIIARMPKSFTIIDKDGCKTQWGWKQSAIGMRAHHFRARACLLSWSRNDDGSTRRHFEQILEDADNQAGRTWPHDFRTQNCTLVLGSDLIPQDSKEAKQARDDARVAAGRPLRMTKAEIKAENQPNKKIHTVSSYGLNLLCEGMPIPPKASTHLDYRWDYGDPEVGNREFDLGFDENTAGDGLDDSTAKYLTTAMYNAAGALDSRRTGCQTTNPPLTIDLTVEDIEPVQTSDVMISNDDHLVSGSPAEASRAENQTPNAASRLPNLSSANQRDSVGSPMLKRTRDHFEGSSEHSEPLPINKRQRVHEPTRPGNLAPAAITKAFIGSSRADTGEMAKQGAEEAMSRLLASSPLPNLPKAALFAKPNVSNSKPQRIHVAAINGQKRSFDSEEGPNSDDAKHRARKRQDIPQMPPPTITASG